MKTTILALSTALVLSGCYPTYAVNRYSISADNVVALRALGTKTVNVGAFTATKTSNGETNIYCRGGSEIKTPDGEKFSDYVRKAFVDELRMANVYSLNAETTLTGNLDSIDFNSNSGNWMISLTLKSSNGKHLSVTENYAYTTSFSGAVACTQTAQAMMPAVQNLVGKAVSSKEFSSLIGR